MNIADGSTHANRVDENGDVISISGEKVGEVEINNDGEGIIVYK